MVPVSISPLALADSALATPEQGGLLLETAAAAVAEDYLSFVGQT